MNSTTATPPTTTPPTFPKTSKTKFANLSDSELYTLCKKYGSLARQARRKFAGLLLEVYKRRLYKRRGYTSIHEFAAKQAGMNQTTVNTILRIAKKLQNKPALKELLESGAQGWSKIEKVAYIATPETDKFWADKVKTLCCRALEAYIRECRRLHIEKHDLARKNSITPNITKSNFINRAVDNGAADNFTKSQNHDLFTHVSNSQPEKLTELQNTKPYVAQKINTIFFKITPELEFKFRLFKQQLEKQKKETLSFAEVLETLLEKASI